MRSAVAYGVRCEVGVGSSYAIGLHEPGLLVPSCVLCVLASDMLGRGGIEDNLVEGNRRT